MCKGPGARRSLVGLYEREKSHELAMESLGRVTQSKVGEGTGITQGPVGPGQFKFYSE